MWAVCAAIACAFLVQDAWAYIENVKTTGCESCALRLTCRHLDSIIAVLEANFEPAEPQQNESWPVAPLAVHPRMALNRRCSGVNHCSFILTKDCPGANTWGFGNLTVKYACVAESRLTKYCNRDIILPAPETIGVSQGFVHNPGYPRFYLGKQECHWKIQAPPLQRVKVTLFDIALIGDPDVPECTDLLEVSDSGQTLYSTCEPQEPPVEVVSLGNSLDVSLQSSPKESILPRRGILFYYTAVGCSTPPAPLDGYLVYRNDTVAEFSCCVGFVFPDTRRRRRIITCLGHRWDAKLPFPDCDNTTQAAEDGALEAIPSKEFIPKSTMADNMEEIVIPTIIMVTLFLLNSIILFVIYKYRQRKLADGSEDELGTLPVSNNKDASS